MFGVVERYHILNNTNHHHTRMNTATRKACRKRTGDDAKPCSVTMPRTLQEAIIRRADAEDRSFSATVRRAIEQYLSKSS
jgi:hypothetical protein